MDYIIQIKGGQVVLTGLLFRRKSLIYVTLLVLLVLPLTACQVPSENEGASIDLTPIETIHNEQGDLVFNISCEELIQRWNVVCHNDDLECLLPDASEMESTVLDRAIHSEHKTKCYVYLPGDEHFFPILSIYTSEESEEILQINLSYNEHDYRENTWELHKDMCLASLRVLMPDQSKSDIEAFCQIVYQEAADNMFPYEQDYGHGAVPSILFHHNGIGVYPYFAAGSRNHFCVIPVDDDLLEQMEATGTEVKEF